MLTRSRTCSLDRRPWPQRAAEALTQPATRYLSRQAACPRGLFGRALGHLWITESAVVNDAAIDLLEPKTDQSILEIGFGPGRTLGLLAARSAQVTGIDVSPAMVNLAARRNAALINDGHLSLHRTNGATIPLPDASIDAVLSVHNLYFWHDPDRTIHEISRVLRPGGRVLLVFHGGEHPLPRRLDPATYRTITTEQAVEWLIKAGYVDARSHRPPNTPRTVTFLTGTTSA